MKTASLGRASGGILEVLLAKEWLNRCKIQHGTFLANKCGAELAMAAEPDGAFHVSFHGEEDGFLGDAASQRLVDHEPHHDFRPAGHHQGLLGVNADAIEQGGNHAHLAPPVLVCQINGGVDLHAASLPAIEFVGVEKIGRRAGAVKQHHPAEILAVAQNREERRAKRRQADSPRDKDQILAHSFLKRPGTSIGPRTPIMSPTLRRPSARVTLPA